MILGIGIDSIEIDRFLHWHKFSAKALKKVFAESEIAYCLENNIKSAERFAVRFAAKEAFFKALSQALPEKQFSNSTVFKNVVVIKEANGRPLLKVQWENFLHENLEWAKNLQIHCSLTHTKTTATAIVIIEKN
jgi:holo-[acyl-carrier protein] synthase